MKKIIDLPDDTIETLEKVSKQQKRTVKAQIEFILISWHDKKIKEL